MKRRDLVKRLTDAGWKLVCNGSRHNIYAKGNQVEPIPRHREINEVTANEILKRAGLK